jgi:DNA uptake protein ComE-like DNA-binding protein
MNDTTATTPRESDSGLALVATLWIMAVLSVLATEYLYVVHLDTRMARNVVNRTQLEFAAKAGIAQFQSILAEDDTTFDSEQEEWAQTLEGELQDPTYSTKFYSFQLTATDENALVDINAASQQVVTRLLASAGAPEDQRDTLAQAVVDARGEQAFRSVGDVARAEGMTSAVLYGSGQPAVEGEEQATPLINLITVYAVDKNVQSEGEDRVNITDADANALVQGLTGEDGAELLSQGEAEAIIAQRDQEQYDSVGDLMDVPAVAQSVLDNVRDQLTTDEDDDDRTNVNSASADDFGNVDGLDQGVGEALVRHRDDSGDYGSVDDIRDAMLLTRDDMKWLTDKATVSGEDTLRGLVNINTASQDVLELLPGMDGDKAQAIIDRRESAPEGASEEDARSPFKNVGELLDVEQIDDDTYKGLVNSIAFRAQAFRVQANGLTPEGEPIARIVAVLDRSGQQVVTRYWLTN